MDRDALGGTADHITKASSDKRTHLNPLLAGTKLAEIVA